LYSIQNTPFENSDVFGVVPTELSDKQ